MLTKSEKKSLLKIIAAGSCSAIILLASLTATVDAETITITFQPSTGSTVNSTGTISSHFTSTTSAASPESGSCLFAAQLASDPALKTAFTTKIRAIKGGAVEESDELIYDSNIDAGSTSSLSLPEPAKSLDSLSYDCLSCHDGVMAQNFNFRIKNNPGGRVMSLEDITGGHPVGMEYNRYVSVGGKDYRSEVTFSREMVFAEGKVGCLTCHNPLNKDRGHLVMNNSRSELCFACHNK